MTFLIIILSYDISNLRLSEQQLYSFWCHQPYTWQSVKLLGTSSHLGPTSEQNPNPTAKQCPKSIRSGRPYRIQQSLSSSTAVRKWTPQLIRFPTCHHMPRVRPVVEYAFFGVSEGTLKFPQMLKWKSVGCEVCKWSGSCWGKKTVGTVKFLGLESKNLSEEEERKELKCLWVLLRFLCCVQGLLKVLYLHCFALLYSVLFFTLYLNLRLEMLYYFFPGFFSYIEKVSVCFCCFE